MCVWGGAQLLKSIVFFFGREKKNNCPQYDKHLLGITMETDVVDNSMLYLKPKLTPTVNLKVN